MPALRKTVIFLLLTCVFSVLFAETEQPVLGKLIEFLIQVSEKVFDGFHDVFSFSFLISDRPVGSLSSLRLQNTIRSVTETSHREYLFKKKEVRRTAPLFRCTERVLFPIVPDRKLPDKIESKAVDRCFLPGDPVFFRSPGFPAVLSFFHSNA